MAEFVELLPVGKEFVSRSRTITEEDFGLLHKVTWLLGPLHTDHKFAEKTQFGEMVMSASCVLACVNGLAATSELNQLLVMGPGVRGVAVLGFDAVRLRAPVKVGDTLTVRSEILDVRTTSKNPRRGVLRIRDVAFNQRDEAVMEETRAVMVERG